MMEVQQLRCIYDIGKNKYGVCMIEGQQLSNIYEEGTRIMEMKKGQELWSIYDGETRIMEYL